MKYRQLGATGISVSEIGFGTWGIGGVTEGATSYGETDDSESFRALTHALERGVTFYDTSNIYGYGHAEELLGTAFHTCREKVIIATKVGFVRHGGSHDVSSVYIRTCLENSLRRLKSDYVDVLQLHSVPLEVVREKPECLETMRSLKRKGKIRAFGYSVRNPADALVAIQEFEIDVVQVNFSMVDQRALIEGVFAMARARDAGIIVRTPLCFGFLTGAITHAQFDARDHRSTWSREQITRWKEAPNAFAVVDDAKQYTPAQLALKFCLGFPEVSTVIPGMLTIAQVDEDIAASDLPSLTDEQLETIERINRESTFFISEKKMHRYG